MYCQDKIIELTKSLNNLKALYEMGLLKKDNIV